MLVGKLRDKITFYIFYFYLTQRQIFSSPPRAVSWSSPNLLRPFLSTWLNDLDPSCTINLQLADFKETYLRIFEEAPCEFNGSISTNIG